MQQRSGNILPIAKLSEVQEGEPLPERKCPHCTNGEVTIYSRTTGEQLYTATCRVCGGTNYAP